MTDVDLWPLAYETLIALEAHYGPAINHAAEELGIGAGEWYGWLLAARLFEPEPISLRLMRKRSAYTAPARLEAGLAKGVELGLLEPVGDGGHRLTPAGYKGISHLIRSAYAAMAHLQPLPKADLERVCSLLGRVVEASLAAPEPPGTWCLRIERRFDPGPAAAVMERLDQAFSDLSAFRDDAHLAAWRPTGASGPAWEAFTLIWRGAAKTLDDVTEKLVRRGFTREAYAAAIRELTDRTWIRQGPEGYGVTESGRKLREEVEATTDRYFSAPWGCLSDAETAELRELLTRLRDALRSTQP